MKKFLKWFKNSTKIKRWLFLILIGIVLACFGFSKILVTDKLELKDLIEIILTFVAGFVFLVIGIVFIQRRTLEIVIEKNQIQLNKESGKSGITDLVSEKGIYKKGPKIVVIGGGTGLNNILAGLKKYTSNLTAIISVTSYGEEKSKAQKELKLQPADNLKDGIIALANSSKSMGALMNYRFKEGKLKDFIANRNIFGVESILDQLEIHGKVRDALMALPELYGSVDILEKAMAYATNKEAKAAIVRLKEIYRILEYYDVTQYVSFDLSMLSRYNYYTGIFFRGYTYGSGDAVVKGGRYDNLLKHFGKDAPSIGFVVVIDELLSALKHQKIEQDGCDEILIVPYDCNHERIAVQLACTMRHQGKRVVLKECSREFGPEQATILNKLIKEYLTEK